MKDNVSTSRKKVFVDKKFQAKFILEYSLLFMLGTALFGLAAYFILDRQIGESRFSAHLAITRTGELLLPTLLMLSLLFVLLLGVAAIFITLLISHKISGPLFAIERYLKLLSEGKLNFEPKLRTNDQTGALADTLNETIRSLRGRIVMIKESADSLGKELPRVASLVIEKGSGQNELLRPINDVQEHLRILKERLDYFATE